MHHSALNASTGFILAARHAGRKPDTTPVTSDTSNAMPTTVNDIVVGRKFLITNVTGSSITGAAPGGMTSKT